MTTNKVLFRKELDKIKNIEGLGTLWKLYIYLIDIIPYKNKEEVIKMSKILFKKKLDDISKIKGNSTMLVSLHVPPTKKVYDVRS